MSEAPHAGGEVILRAEDVAVHFGGVKAVDGMSFELTAGKIFGMLGPNGSGKTTLLAALTRLVPLTRGSLTLDGEPFDRVSAAGVARRRVARTFQTVRLLPDLTVLENVQLGADLHGARTAADTATPDGEGGADAAALVAEPAPAGGQRRGATALLASVRDRVRGQGPNAAVRAAIERTRLSGLEALRPGELSYGTQRRVEIARAMAMRPRLLLLDEPTAGMNQGERREISELMRELRAEGLTQLLVEHDVQMMIDTCDYVFAMNFGRLIAEGTPSAVVRDPGVQEAYLGKKWRQHA